MKPPPRTRTKPERDLKPELLPQRSDPLCGGISEEQSDLMCQLQLEEEEVGGEEGQKAH